MLWIVKSEWPHEQSLVNIELPAYTNLLDDRIASSQGIEGGDGWKVFDVLRYRSSKVQNGEIA